jgi:hypothetical protein
MEFNSVLFPAPESSFDYRELDFVLWIPKKEPLRSPNTLKVTQRNSSSDDSQSDGRQSQKLSSEGKSTDSQ